jgi:putative effector of murein hydrolase LrgA (UPF0299 family)
MPMLLAILTLVLMQLIGEALVRFLDVPLPGALLGFLLLFGALVVHGRLPKGLRDTSNHTLPHLMLLFIAPVAGIMLHFDRIASEWLPFLVACIAGTAVTIAVTALTFRWALRRSKVGQQ